MCTIYIKSVMKKYSMWTTNHVQFISKVLSVALFYLKSPIPWQPMSFRILLCAQVWASRIAPQDMVLVGVFLSTPVCTEAVQSTLMAKNLQSFPPHIHPDTCVHWGIHCFTAIRTSVLTCLALCQQEDKHFSLFFKAWIKLFLLCSHHSVLLHSATWRVFTLSEQIGLAF